MSNLATNDYSNSPLWLADAKQRITETNEWRLFLDDLHDIIQQQLIESHVLSFGELTQNEKSLILERAVKTIESGESYHIISQKSSFLLDQHLNNEIAKQFLENYPIDTKTDLTLELTVQGIIALLQKWPEMKSKLKVCFNQTLPSSLRQLIWKTFLQNNKVKTAYTEILDKRPEEAISKHDLDISKKCEKLLNTEPTFKTLKGSIGAFYTMKAVLSYHHSLKQTNSPLSDSDYFLIIPFLQLVSDKISRQQPASNTAVSQIIEMFLTFMSSRPSIISNNVKQNQVNYSNKVINYLTRLDRDLPLLFDFFEDEKRNNTINKNRENNTESATSEKEINNHIVEEIAKITGFMAKSMFVGLVDIPVVMFIWDQYILGLNSPGFNDEFIPILTAIIVFLLKEELKTCKKSNEMFNLIKINAKKLAVSQFRIVIKKYFYKVLMEFHNLSDATCHLPILDLTQAKESAWTHWFNNRIPPRTTPQIRRKAREERQAEYQRLQMQKNLKEERIIKDKETLRQAREDSLLQQLNKEKKENELYRLDLENKLLNEKKRRDEIEKESEKEIIALRKELDMYKKLKTPASPSASSLHSQISKLLIPPPNTACSSPSLNLVQESPLPSTSQPKSVEQISIEMLRKIVSSFNTLSHGDPEEKAILDVETDKLINKYCMEIREAEKIVFGRVLEENEFEELPPDRQKETTDKIMSIVIKKLKEEKQK